MLKIISHDRILKLGIALFLVGQLFSVAHASEFGPAPHEHNGVACIAILGDEQDALIPTSSLVEPIFVFFPTAITRTAREGHLDLIRAIRPPPTGPPAV